VEKLLTVIEWHRLFHGFYARVAKELGIDRSYVNRVALGQRRSPKIERAINAEIARIEKLRPK